ncbi:hypothetical protein F5X99DRAFT_370118 [Biscogniauxia marginata]|nr:hypothetical protein F5X99DRAFT_370118 [Biscogniauxia marginata]
MLASYILLRLLAPLVNRCRSIGLACISRPRAQNHLNLQLTRIQTSSRTPHARIEIYGEAPKPIPRGSRRPDGSDNARLWQICEGSFAKLDVTRYVVRTAT